MQGAAILEAQFQRHPDHPGVAHYLIHAYDYPSIADKGLAAAMCYPDIAPSAPHALHMPSHIFTRVGLWSGSAGTNTRSIAAAIGEAERQDRLHALDYMVYADLQLARDADAKAGVEQVRQTPFGEGTGSTYSRAAVPARYAIERGHWAEAAILDDPDVSKFPYTDAIRYFGRALGAARSGNPGGATKDVARLHEIAEALKAANDGYGSTEVEVQRISSKAWVAFADSQRDEALSQMRAAADMEDKSEKHPVSPGRLIPARGVRGLTSSRSETVPRVLGCGPSCGAGRQQGQSALSFHPTHRDGRVGRSASRIGASARLPREKIARPASGAEYVSPDPNPASACTKCVHYKPELRHHLGHRNGARHRDRDDPRPVQFSRRGGQSRRLRDLSMELSLIDRVTLTRVREGQRQIITNLIQLYKYDFSEFAEIGSPYGEVGPDGRFIYEGLDRYWGEDGWVPLMVEADGRLAGCVLVNRWSALNRLVDHSVAEFFILRKYRRIGVGSRAARILFERWPGRWEVAVARYNKPALSFWRKAIRAAVDGPVEEYTGDFERHIGTVFRFDRRPRKS